jgi:hypothetical protein
LGIKPIGFPFFVILAPNWEAGEKRRQSGIKKIEIYLNNEFNYCTPSPRNETGLTRLPLKNSVADFENGPIAAPLKPKVIIVCAPGVNTIFLVYLGVVQPQPTITLSKVIFELLIF